jgi:hypothetical protein
MYTKLYDFLKPKIGHNAAKKATYIQYANFNLVIAGPVVVIVSYGRERHYWVIVSGLLMLVAMVAINIKHRMNFADALSEQFKTKISWLELPSFSSLDRLDAWLTSLKNRSGV